MDRGLRNECSLCGDVRHEKTRRPVHRIITRRNQRALPDAIGELIREGTNGSYLWPVVDKEVAQLEQAPHSIVPDHCANVPAGRLTDDGLDQLIGARETSPPLLD